MSGEQKYKDGDALSQSFGATNRGELLIFTDRQQVYKAKLCDFGFFRVHRRYIVNLACVTDVETVPSGAIQLGITGVDERVPVSRRRVVPLKKALSL
mgnify:FL=1